MNESIVEDWVSKVSPDDHVFHLGDVLFGSNFDILSRLPGKKHLIVGNHDHRNIKRREFTRFFETVDDYVSLKLQGTNFIMMHYPLESWDKMLYGSIHVHGHSHGTMRKMNGRFDVGIDAHPEGKIFSLDEILRLDKQI